VSIHEAFVQLVIIVWLIPALHVLNSAPKKKDDDQ
jgi:hypothetical protein